MDEPADSAEPPQDDAPLPEIQFSAELSQSAPPTASTRSPVTDMVRASQGGVAESKSEQDAVPEEARPFLNDPVHRLNQYVLVVQLGAGGMGTVWKGWDTKLTRWVAIKFLSSADETSVKRFQREAQMAGRLHHSNICAVHEVGEANQVHFLVMDFVEGCPIDKAKLPLNDMLRSFEKACRAIDFAHRQKIIHRDIKPANIMFSKDGEPFVTDFGLAKVAQSQSSLSMEGSVLGTPAYMSPEQAMGKLDTLDARSDVYSLGATLYALATEHPPFQGEYFTEVLYKVTNLEPLPPRQANPTLPAPVEAIILKAMDKSRERRYASASEMADDIRRFLEAQPVSAKTSAPVRKKKTALVAAAATLLLLATGVVVMFIVRQGPSPDAPKQGDTYSDVRPAGEGVLELRVRPDGAEFTLTPLGGGEKLQGAIVSAGMKLRAGRYAVRISKSGCLPHGREIEIAPGKPVVLEVELRPMEIWNRPTAPLGVRVARDLNGDGIADIFLIGDMRAKYLSGADGNTFWSTAIDADDKRDSVRLYGASSLDLDGDGRTDFLVVLRERHYLRLHAFGGTRPTELFRAECEASELPDLVPGDLNGDGIPDWAWKRGAFLRAVSGKERKTIWETAQRQDPRVILCHAGDLDGDGWGDVVCGDAQENLTVRSGRNGSVIFQAEKTTLFDILPDADGDGRNDILAADATTTFALSGAKRLWAHPGRPLSHRCPGADLVLIRSGATVSAVSGRDGRKLWESGEFQADDVWVGMDADSILIGEKRAASFSRKTGKLLWETRSGGEVEGTEDLTGDGVPDFVSASGARLSLISGKDGTGVWEYDAGSAIRFWGTGDFDGDGKADCVVTTKEALRTLRARE